MRTRFLFPITFLAAVLPARAVFDFSGEQKAEIQDGNEMSIVTVHHDGKKLKFTNLAEWLVETSPGAITLRTRREDRGEAVIRSSPGAVLPFDEKGLAVYREYVLKLVPAAVKNAKVTAEQANPIPINRWKSYRFRIEYTVGVEAVVKTVVFVQVNPKEQVQIVTTSPKDQHETLYTASRDFFYTWSEEKVATVEKPGAAGAPAKPAAVK